MSSFNALTKSPVQAPAERHRATPASPVLKVHKELALWISPPMQAVADVIAEAT